MTSWLRAKRAWQQYGHQLYINTKRKKLTRIEMSKVAWRQVLGFV